MLILIRQREPAVLDLARLGQLRLFCCSCAACSSRSRPAAGVRQRQHRRTPAFRVLGDGLFEPIARRPPTFFTAHAVRLRAWIARSRWRICDWSPRFSSSESMPAGWSLRATP